MAETGKWLSGSGDVQLGETGAGRPQQGGRDVPDGDRGPADPVHQEAAAAGGDLPLPRLPLAGAGGRRLPEQAHGAAGGPVLHREDHLHQVPAGAGFPRDADRPRADHRRLHRRDVRGERRRRPRQRPGGRPQEALQETQRLRKLLPQQVHLLSDAQSGPPEHQHHRHAGHPVGGEAEDQQRLRLRRGPALVRGAGGPDHSAVRRPQAGHFRRVLGGHQGLQGSGRQDPGGPEQGRPGGHAAADAGVRRPHVVTGESDQHSRGGSGLSGLLLGQTAAEHREPPAVRGRVSGPVPGHPESSPERRPAETQRPDQESAARQGARLHHQLPEEGDAVAVRPREEEGGVDHEAAGDLHPPAEGAPHQPRRLPQRGQDAGHAAALRLQQVPVAEDEADRVGGQDARQQDRRPHVDDPRRGVQAAAGDGVGRRLRGLPGRPLRPRLRRGHQRRRRRRRLDREPRQAPLRRDLLHADADQRQDQRRQRQEGDDELAAAQHRAGQDLEAGRLRPRRHAGRRGVRAGPAPHQGEAGGLRAAHRATRPPGAAGAPQEPHRRRPVQQRRGLGGGASSQRHK